MISPGRRAKIINEHRRVLDESGDADAAALAVLRAAEVEFENALERKLYKLPKSAALVLVGERRKRRGREIIVATAAHCGVPSTRVLRDRTSPAIARVRFVAAAVMRREDWSLQEIGRALGLDFSSVWHGLRVVEREDELKRLVEEIAGQVITSGAAA